MRLLIVDDNDVDRYLLTLAIRRLHPNAEIIEAKDADEGIRRVYEVHPDMVLSDLSMPSKLGASDLAWLAHQGGAAVILVTGMPAWAPRGEKVVEKCSNPAVLAERLAAVGA